MSFNAARDGKVFVMSEKCRTCIFHPGNRMRLRPGRVREMVREACGNDSAIICHTTLGTAENAVCRGFFDRYGSHVLPLRLAIAISAVEWQDENEKSGTINMPKHSVLLA